jgi:hypothetical protein
MAETCGKSVATRRFQFGLRSLIVLSIGVALCRWNPDAAVVMAILVFLPFLALGRWLVKNGQTRTGIGCVGSILLILVPWLAVILTKGDDGDRDPGALELILGVCGYVGLFTCFCALIPFMADREDRLNREAHCNDRAGSD